MTARSGYGEEGKLDQGFSMMRAVFDCIPDPAHVIDRDYRVVMTNKRLLDLRGLEQEAIVGQPCYGVYQERDTRCPECAAWKTFESGKPAQVNKTLQIPDGSFRYFEVSAFPVMGEDGSVRYAMELTRDITDLKQSEMALQKSQDRLHAALEANLDSFFCFQAERDDRGDVRDFILVNVNARAERLLRRSREELVGKRLAEVLPIGREAGLLEKYRQVVETGVALEEEFCLSGPAGSTAWHYHQVAPLEDGVAVCHRNISRRKETEKTLRENEQKFSQAFHNSPIAMALSTADEGRYLDVNAEFLRMAERRREEVIGHTALELGIWAGPDKRADVIEQLKKQERVRNVEVEGRSSSGKVLSLLISFEKVLINNKPFLLSSAIEITDLKRGEAERETLQAQLLQAQKMEAVGRLAGGLAHDFNNMLSVILGQTEMGCMNLDPADPLYGRLMQIQKSAERSAGLVRQLLGFARKQAIAPRILDLNETVGGMLTMLRRLIGEDIDLAWMPGASLWTVNMDPSQIDQILINLCVNARDAITDVGKITVETRNIILDGEYCAQHAGFVPGEYALLTVSDNGCGMERDILEKIFDPFFTTKESGKGTGLGLATVYGIVKQNKGFVNAYSEPGQGAAFRIYLPRHAHVGEKIRESGPTTSLKGGHETVLLVEDEPMLLEIGESMLERCGYTVLCAGSPTEAIRVAEEHAGEIHLLMTDVVMPEMNGPHMARRILSSNPRLKCLFMSGYTANAIAHQGVLDEGVHFIQKPFTLQDLAEKIRQALGEEGVEPRGSR